MYHHHQLPSLSSYAFVYFVTATLYHNQHCRMSQPSMKNKFPVRLPFPSDNMDSMTPPPRRRPGKRRKNCSSYVFIFLDAEYFFSTFSFFSAPHILPHYVRHAYSISISSKFFLIHKVRLFLLPYCQPLLF